MTKNEQLAEKIIDRLIQDKKDAVSADNWKKNTFRKIMRDGIVDEIKQFNKMPTVTFSEEVEIIYQLYPRKVAPQAAKKAIRNSLKISSFQHLRNRTMAYADAVAKWPKHVRYNSKGSEMVPHPATWFNRGSYDDDPREWEGDRRYAPTKPQNAPEGPPADWVDRFMRKYSSSDWEALKGAVRRNSDGKVFHWQDLPADLRTELLER